MVESDNPNLTPEELNFHFRQLWEQFPEPIRIEQDPNFLSMTKEEQQRYVNEKDTEYNELMDRRGRSEHKHRVMSSVENIFKQSCFTPTGKLMAVRVLSEYYDEGVEKEPIIIENDEAGHTHIFYESISLALLDLENPNSGGIFDPNRAKVLEKDFYREIVQGRLTTYSEFEHSTFEMGGKTMSKEEVMTWFGGLEHERDNVYGGNFVKMLGRWRQELVDKLGEEP